MSLMLDALKRIEAKQASARAAASAAEPIEGDCPNFHHTEARSASEALDLANRPRLRVGLLCDKLSDDLCGQPLAGENGTDPLATPIELPPPLPADGAAELAAEDIALPGDVSLETAMSELSDLLAEARLLDRPPPVPEPAATPSVEREADGAQVNWAGISSVAPSQALIEAPAISPWQPITTYDNEAKSDHALPTGIDERSEAIDEETVAGDPAQVFTEPPVIEPVGSDPYAVAAWQILRQLPEGRSQIVLFTSPGDGHGKTITLARLLPHVARSFSGSVLVVDANTRNPDLARWLEVAATWRLTDVLAGATHWMNAVRPTALPRVSLLPGGTAISRQSNVEAAARLLRELAAHYDLVLVDASSLAHAGAAPLAASCDGTCLVVRLGEGSRRVVREAVRVVSRAGGHLLGCIAIDAGA